MDNQRSACGSLQFNQTRVKNWRRRALNLLRHLFVLAGFIMLIGQVQSFSAKEYGKAPVDTMTASLETAECVPPACAYQLVPR
jgi:hypothetical protein